jgi:glycosyltransferase involved in cell wall biosynthesis
MRITSENNQKGLSIVVFQKNAGVDLLNTLNILEDALREFNELSVEIIVIDDASKIKPNLGKHQKIIKSYVELENNVGISGAIYQGALLAKFSMLLAVPGSNMYSIEAYKNLFMAIRQEGDLIMGYRNNLFTERPFVKYISSKMLLIIYKIMTKNYHVKDIHGLNCFQTKDVLHHLPRDAGHSGQLQLLTAVLNRKIKIIEVAAPILKNHKLRPSASKKDSFPAPKALIDVLKGLTILRKI